MDLIPFTNSDFEMILQKPFGLFGYTKSSHISIGIVASTHIFIIKNSVIEIVTATKEHT